MNLVAERNWSWMLFEDEGIFILSVICGGVGIYTREIQLSANELAEYRAKGEKFLDVIARDISYAQSKYTARQIVNFTATQLSRLQWTYGGLQLGKRHKYQPPVCRLNQTVFDRYKFACRNAKCSKRFSALVSDRAN